jgi:anaerobic magnesium-protoporphyrin IX monomethyl ester cyclase
MTVRFLYPPFADPTQPYASLPHLKGFLGAEGLDVTVIDLNVEAAHALLAPAHIAEEAGHLAERFAALNGRATLNGAEQMEYLALLHARPAALRGLAPGGSAVQTFMHAGRFYDRRQYRPARDQAEDAMACLSANRFPFGFSFNRAAHAAVPWNLALLETYFRQRRSPLDPLYRRLFAQWRLAPEDVVGISLTFISQIPETFYLLHLLRQEAPAVFTLLGGTCAQQILRHAPEAIRQKILNLASAACPFEGEACLSQLLSALAAAPPHETAAQRFDRLRGVPNLWLSDPTDGRRHAGPVKITDLTCSPAPDYSDLDLDRYLAPSRTLLFAPTRGCYWNRCSFCDYGLNRSGLHTYREMAPEAAARQLVVLSRQYQVRNFYLSVDVLAPKFALALAEALISQKADICWAADFRMEPYYTPERCALLFRSGLRAVAFGVESGSEALLRAMRKGIDVNTIRRVNAAFHGAGIATAWMTFSDHPGETAEQMRATIRLIEAHQTAVDLFILGRFGLTGGAHIAACPEQYGIQDIFYCRGDDFRLFPLYNHPAPLARADAHNIEGEVQRISSLYLLDHYPWAGAISTHHTLLYFLRFGTGAFRRRAGRPMRPTALVTARRPPKGLTVPPAFDTEKMQIDQQRRMQRLFERALTLQGDGTAPLDEEYFLRVLAKWPLARSHGGRGEG